MLDAGTPTHSPRPSGSFCPTWHRARPWWRSPATSPTRRTAGPWLTPPGSLGGLDLLVNNASTLGATPLPRLVAYPLEELTRALRGQRRGAARPRAAGRRAAAPSARPAVLNITSDASVEAYEGWGGYGLSKAALDHLSAVLAVEEPAMRVWAVDPGDMRTQMHQDAFPGRGHLGPPHARRGRARPRAPDRRGPAERAVPPVRRCDRLVPRWRELVTTLTPVGPGPAPSEACPPSSSHPSSRRAHPPRPGG